MQKITSFIVLSLWCNFFLSMQSQAQNELPPIQLDRPDLTESPYVTPHKFLQFENGLLWSHENVNTDSYTLPTILAKYGISNRSELRLIVNYQLDKTRSNSMSGVPPIWVGFKSNLVTAKGLIPQLSFIGHLAIPNFASDSYRAKFIAPKFRFVMQHNISEKLSFSYNLGMEWDGFTADPFNIYTTTFGYSINDRLGCFIEMFGEGQFNQPFQHNVDGGFTFLVNRNAMFDISSGIALQQNPRSFFLSCGYSFRVNTHHEPSVIFVK